MTKQVRNDLELPRQQDTQNLPSDTQAFISPALLAAAVRFHRKKSGLSQAQLAQLANVGKTSIFDLEKGKPSLQLNTVLKVLEILNIQTYFHSPLMKSFQKSLKPT